MPGAPERREATYEDLLALPDDVLGQIFEGELHATRRPAIDHQRASSTLGFDLGVPFDRGRGGPGGWWIVEEPSVTSEAGSGKTSAS